jgi:hypothetical protein
MAKGKVKLEMRARWLEGSRGRQRMHSERSGNESRAVRNAISVTRNEPWAARNELETVRNEFVTARNEFVTARNEDRAARDENRVARFYCKAARNAVEGREIKFVEIAAANKGQ